MSVARENVTFFTKVKDYLLDTSLHGAPHIVDSRRSKVWRVLWTSQLLGMVALFWYFFRAGFTRFAERPVSTVLNYRQLPAAVNFPSVTLCNFNLVNRTFLDEQDEFLEQAASQMTATPLPLNMTDPDVIRKLQDVQMDVLGKNASHTIEATFLSCVFNNDYSKNICQNHKLLVRKMTTLGYCYMFNPETYTDNNSPLTTLRTGPKGGLVMEIDIHQELYFLYHEGGAGMIVQVHDPHDEPMIADLGLLVHPGTMTGLTVTKTEIENLPLPYNRDQGASCVETNTAKNASFENPLKYFKHYSYAACQMECLIQFIWQRCGCKKFYHSAPNLRTCNMYEFMTCATPAETLYYKSLEPELDCRCFQPCRKVQYDVTISQAYYPNDVAVTHMIRNGSSTDLEYIRKNRINLAIYFRDLGYTVMKQVPAYTETNMFAEMGGHLGLCLGASLLTLIELFEFLIMLCVGLCNKGAKTDPTSHNGIPVVENLAQSTIHETNKI